MTQQKNSEKLLKGIILVLDAVLTAVSLMIAFKIRYGTFLGVNENGDSVWICYIVVAISLLAGLMFDFTVHFIRRGAFVEFTEALKRQIIVTGGLAVLLYLMHRGSELSRLVFGYFSIADLLLTFIFHRLLKVFLLKVYKKGKFASRLLLLASPENAEKVVENFHTHQIWDSNIKGIAVWGTDVPRTVGGEEVVADKKTFMDYVTRQDVDEVFISAGKLTQSPEVQEIISQLVLMGIKVELDIDLFEMDVPGKKTLSQVGHYAVVSIAKNNYPAVALFVKRLFDLFGGLIGCAFLAVISIFLVPAIKLDSPGPALFKQTRVGKNGRLFTFYKFRSMCNDAEAQKKALMAKNEVNGLMFKMEDDPRITKVGKFIRKTSLDEFPQFINVLKGDMSLVGTRPPTMDEFEHYTPSQKSRLSMRPGITGMWQVSGRSDIKDFNEVVRLDMSYIDNWSLGLDVKILFKTVFAVLGHKGSK